jgi:hypothetical protein
MKKILLLLSITAVVSTANAQLALVGASPYTQNFDLIGTSLPTGWIAYTGATSTALGTIYSWSGSTKFGVWADSITGPCKYCSDIFGKGFKNSASFDGSAASDTGGVQRSRSDRAFAVKQTSAAGYEPGPAFVLHVANTTGISNLGLNFKLQSLDYTCARVTTWAIDYAVGSSPSSFTRVAVVGDSTTGGFSFKSNNVSASFGTALDNKSQEIWIRIVNLNASTGSGSRTTTGIDDFSLTWTGSAGAASVNDVNSQNEIGLTVLGAATTDNVTIGYNIPENATYNFAIYDITGRTRHSETINAKSGAQQFTVSGLHLAPGMYFAKMNNENSSSIAKIIVQ